MDSVWFAWLRPVTRHVTSWRGQQLQWAGFGLTSHHFVIQYPFGYDPAPVNRLWSGVRASSQVALFLPLEVFCVWSNVHITHLNFYLMWTELNWTELNWIRSDVQFSSDEIRWGGRCEHAFKISICFVCMVALSQTTPSPPTSNLIKVDSSWLVGTGD